MQWLLDVDQQYLRDLERPAPSRPIRSGRRTAYRAALAALLAIVIGEVALIAIPGLKAHLLGSPAVTSPGLSGRLVARDSAGPANLLAQAVVVVGPVSPLPVSQPLASPHPAAVPHPRPASTAVIGHHPSALPTVASVPRAEPASRPLPSPPPVTISRPSAPRPAAPDTTTLAEAPPPPIESALSLPRSLPATAKALTVPQPAAAPKADPPKAAAPKPATAAASRPTPPLDQHLRVALSFTADEAPTAAAFAQQLRRQGFAVTSIVIPVTPGRWPGVAFFFDSDRARAHTIAQQLGAVTGRHEHARLSPRHPYPRPGTVEVSLLSNRRTAARTSGKPGDTPR
jgi:hypothetical protein